jgi:hypothetical protein
VYNPWEKAFTIVQWAQRRAGYTFGRYGTNTPDVTLERISRDGVDLAEYPCRPRPLMGLYRRCPHGAHVHLPEIRPQIKR